MCLGKGQAPLRGMEQLQDVKKRIRALLTSSRGGCSLRQLCVDYKEVTGDDIPYSALGHRSMMSFVRSIPDVIAIQMKPDGRAVLYAVPLEKTKHMSRMIARQKSSSSGRPGFQARASQHNSAQHVTRTKKVPAKFAIQLKTLFLSYPNGISLERFPDAFALRFGYYLNYRSLGFSSLDEVFQLTEGVRVERDPLRGSAVLKQERERAGVIGSSSACLCALW